jgi:mannose-6-phosphate isomerase-like protein (cupin superfamily)
MVFGIISASLLFTIAAAGSGKSSDLPQAKTSGKAPSTASQPFLFVTGQAMAEAIKELQPGNGTKNLINGAAISCRAYLQHEKDVATNQAEVHDGADDIFIIQEGTATFILGGKLDAPTEIQPGEWRAANIAGGQEFKLAKGDMIVVPRGTPHRRITAGQDVTFLIIKAFAPSANK